MNIEINSLVNAAYKHCLIVNPAKSKTMFFGAKSTRSDVKQRFSILLNNESIPKVNSARNLGLLIDEELKFVEHINKCLQKGYFVLKYFYPNRRILSEKIKTLIANSFVLSNLNFCSSIYGPCIDVRTSNRIQLLQNSCLRFVLGIRKYDHVSSKLKMPNGLI